MKPFVLKTKKVFNLRLTLSLKTAILIFPNNRFISSQTTRQASCTARGSTFAPMLFNIFLGDYVFPKTSNFNCKRLQPFF